MVLLIRGQQLVRLIFHWKLSQSYCRERVFGLLFSLKTAGLCAYFPIDHLVDFKINYLPVSGFVSDIWRAVNLGSIFTILPGLVAVG
jgi:hypothetical protein